MNERETDGLRVTEGLPDMAAAYEGLMRAKEAYRAEAHRSARELADAREALKPFADLSEVCVHFKKLPFKKYALGGLTASVTRVRPWQIAITRGESLAPLLNRL